MKKLTKILILVLSVALLAGVFMLASSAADAAPEATTHVAFKIYDKNGTEITTNAKTVGGVTGYVTIKDAFDNATDGSTIKMVADFEMGTAITAISTGSKDLTLDFNGHTLAISYNKIDGSTKSYQIVSANSGKTLTLTGNGTLKTCIAWMASDFRVIGGR